MMNFKHLELEDRKIFTRYLGGYNFHTYEYSFPTLYLWRKMCNVEYGIFEDALIVKKTLKGVGSYFMQPLGCGRENLGNVVRKLLAVKNGNPAFGSLFRDIEAGFLEELIDYFGQAVKYCEDTDNFDYIYNCRDLISLSGSKYHSKKNHYNHFVSTYPYEIREMTDREVAKDCMDFAVDWYRERGHEDEQLKYELECMEDVINSVEALDIKGMAVYVDRRVAGFTIGEEVNRDMAIIHIEKGDLAYSGIYAFINKAFAEKYFSGVTYINRQEDMGLEGLRKAKMAYRPVRLEKKYIVDIEW